MRKELFDELKQSLAEAVDHSAGKKLDLRTRTLVRPTPPKPMSKSQIAALRKRMNMSQAVFAQFVNVSVKTVQAWEQGQGKPAGAALKLLRIAQRDPQVLFN